MIGPRSRVCQPTNSRRWLSNVGRTSGLFSVAAVERLGNTSSQGAVIGDEALRLFLPQDLQRLNTCATKRTDERAGSRNCTERKDGDCDCRQVDGFNAVQLTAHVAPKGPQKRQRKRAPEDDEAQRFAQEERFAPDG